MPSRKSSSKSPQTKIRRWRKKYSVPDYIYSELKQMRPPENLTVAEWAEKYRILTSKTSAIPGPWRNQKTPYLVEIMNELTNYETEEIVFCKCTQIGGSEALLNMLGYLIQQDPGPAMIVYPTDVLAKSISVNRVQPMIEGSPTLRELYRDRESSALELQFDGMYLSMVGSNSPSGLASKAVRFLGLDEVDKFPGASGKEADPISLAKERQKTFANRIRFLTSTPTHKTGQIWVALEACDIEKHYFVPCPHCGEMFEFKWQGVWFPPEKADDGSILTAAERADMACYVCPSCACHIYDHHKEAMLRAGEWRIVRESNTVHRSVGYWINTIYSPFVRFSDMVLEFLKAKDNPERLQNFVNSWLAEPWEDTRLKTSAETVLKRQTEVPQFIVPSWAKLLTGGVDVQETCMYWTIRAWGDHITSQNICHGQAMSWVDIERVMNLGYTTEDGQQLVVSLCLIDSGFDSDSVYDFCATNFDWAIPCKGSSAPMMSNFKISKINRENSRMDGMNLVMVDTDKYKDMLAARMQKPNGRGSWMVYKGIDRDYCEQVTAEHKVSEKHGERIVQRWKPKRSRIDNHYLDTEVYALCAADIRGVRSMHLQDQVEEAAPKQQQREAPTPEESWIHNAEGWL